MSFAFDYERDFKADLVDIQDDFGKLWKHVNSNTEFSGILRLIDSPLFASGEVSTGTNYDQVGELRFIKTEFPNVEEEMTLDQVDNQRIWVVTKLIDDDHGEIIIEIHRRKELKRGNF